MKKVKDKRVLKLIAKEWAKGILLATELASFDEDSDEYLDLDEQSYIVEEVHKIANRITEEDSLPSLNRIIEKYFKLH